MDRRSLTPSSFILQRLSPYRWQVMAGIVFVLITTIFQLISPYLLRYAIDFISYVKTGAAKESVSQLSSHFGEFMKWPPERIVFTFAGLIIFATVIQGIFRYLMRITLIGVSRRIEYDIRNGYFSHLERLSQSFFHQHKTGDLMARATNDLEAVRSMFGPGIMHLVSTIFVTIATVFFMFKTSVILTLWTLIPSPVVAFVVNRLLAKIHKMFEKIQAQFAAVNSKVEENLSGIRVIKSYSQEENEIKVFKRQNRELVNRNIALARVRALLRGEIQFLLGLGFVLVLWIGGTLVIGNRLTIGGLVAFLAYLAMLAWPMIALGWVLNIWQQGLVSLKRILLIWNAEPEIKDNADTDFGITGIHGQIEFDNVCFGYGDGPPVLKNISFRIPRGATFALVGPTGAGKTTLINLIPRILQATDGMVKIDGNDISKIPLKVLRENIGLVPQETYLFSTTLKENIAFGVVESDNTHIEEAAEVSQINRDLDQLSDGYDTIIGERGVTLSGGQKQRTAISRAIIRNPQILILDDSLSSVDTYTEERVLARLKGVMQNRTSIIVSHRISTVRDADYIIVLDSGEIAERGTHDELLSLRGIYYHLYERQLLEQDLDTL